MRGPLLGAIEGGGTKFVCAVGYGAERILERVILPTRGPQETLGAALDFFSRVAGAAGPIEAIGIAAFGPLDLRVGSAGYGRLMATPKPGWSGTDLVTPFRRRFAAPVAIDTDVAAAALAELRLGAGREARSVAYVTVGTGIGGGFAPAPCEGHYLLHPEVGHLRVQRDARDRDFKGVCPFHGDCLEGLASGPAIRARWGQEITCFPPGHPAWSIIGNYLGQLAAALVLSVSPERLILGGGVLSGGQLLEPIRRSVRALLNGYIGPLNDVGALERYICAAGLGDAAGLTGAFLLAAQALSTERASI